MIFKMNQKKLSNIQKKKFLNKKQKKFKKKKKMKFCLIENFQIQTYKKRH